jgi:hypothetical protein
LVPVWESKKPKIIFQKDENPKLLKSLFLLSLDAAHRPEAKMYWAQALDPAG